MPSPLTGFEGGTIGAMRTQHEPIRRAQEELPACAGAISADLEMLMKSIVQERTNGAAKDARIAELEADLEACQSTSAELLRHATELQVAIGKERDEVERLTRELAELRALRPLIEQMRDLATEMLTSRASGRAQ